VDRHVEADRFQPVEFFLRPGGPDDLGADRLGRLQRRHAHARGHAGHEEPLAGLELALSDEHVVHHHEGKRDRARLLPRDVRRHRDRVALVHEAELGEASRAAPHDALAGAEHLARRFLSGGLGGARGDQAVPGDELAAVQARGVDLHEMLVRCRLRRRHLAQLEVHFVACRLQKIGLHRASNK
jgi:hypothetical protein